MRSHFKLFILIAVFGTVLLSCRKSTETDWDVDIQAPIARSSLNIKNFLNDSLFTSGPGGLLHLSFSKKIAGFQLDSLIAIPDTVLNYSFFLAPGSKLFIAPGSNIPGFPQTQEILLDISNGVELRNVVINEGKIKIDYTNTYTQPLVFDLTLPGTTKYGIPFSIKETINPGASNSTKYYDISGYNIKLTGTTGNKINALVQNINVSVAPTAQPDTIRGGQGVATKLSYTKLVPYYVEGYFGQQNINLDYDSVALNLSKNLQASNFKINSAYINFNIVNEFGVDINAQLNNINSINTFSNNSVPLNANGLSNLNINRAGKTNNFSSPVFPSVKSVSVNTTNSNLKPFLENLPDYLTYQGKIVINPFGNISGSNDFAFLNTGINIYAEVDMPLQINADYFRLTSTTAIDLTNIQQIENINYGKLILQATNGYPFNAVLQGYILNEQNQVIDSLFTIPNNVIQRGSIDANYYVLNPVYTKLEINLDQTKLEHLKACKFIRFVSQFNMPTPQPPDIKILDKYNLDIILSFDINYKARRK